jgi:putative N6-adenine-specific DNA methylase
MTPVPPFQCIAQCPPGLEPILARELATLGVEGRQVQGGVEWEGGWLPLIRANLELRVAGRVLVTVGAFRARALGELERKAGGLAWDELLPPGPIHFRVSASRSRLNHTRAVAERLQRASDREPAAGRELPDGDAEDGDDNPGRGEGGTLVLARILRDQVTLRLDASGEHLHRRGYRSRVGEAPLRETLAAAALLASGWTPDLPLADPFCGSGTIPLEAALIARRIPPGLAREARAPRGWAMEAWPGFPRDLLAEVVDRARNGMLPEGPAAILGSDRDGRVLEAARANARAAGVPGDVTFQEAPATRCPLPGGGGPGWIVTNPPYGVRLGDRRGLRTLYRALGQAGRGPWRGWGLAVLSGDPVLTREMDLPLKEGFRTRHGGREVRLGVREPERSHAGGDAP